MGVQCPGPRKEAFFVHTVSRDSSAATAVWPSASTCVEKGGDDVVSYGLGLQSRTLVHAPLVPDLKSCRASAFDQLFISHFIESFGRFAGLRSPLPPNTTWLDELPHFMTSPGNTLAKTSIRSATMLSYGAWACDVSVQAEAYRWYAQALQMLRSVLSQANPLRMKSTLCAAVMMIHFETWGFTAEGAWIKHVRGAEAILEGLGPDACADGFMHQVFTHLRFQSFIAAMQQDRVSIFSSLEWMTVPFEVQPANIFDFIVTILINVQSCLSVGNKLLQNDTRRASLEPHLKQLLHQTTSKLNKWEKEFLPLMTNFSSDAMLPSSRVDTHESRSNLHPQILFNSLPEAALLSLYHAASLVVAGLSALAHPTMATDRNHQQIHTQEIFRACDFISSNSDSEPSSKLGPIMMVPQLKMAALWSVDEHDRNAATCMLIQIGTKRHFALEGIWHRSAGYFAGVASYTHDVLS
ncbi:hypothetical protein QQS21_007061 [Conoideocrella luteorostrata]|uniref:Uncharacterized protein n=1 Tax=Conoideocrella luteorostrata TaxID=1105319 RepID=A0AAJ0CLG0_9HYPO|nr:hypothetical protein QQS21_007061 [Conoideocrella luteorostrata]